MENKIVLYNSDNVKIGETYLRRARQLIRQQRAVWVDENETAIRFAPGMENMDTVIDDNPLDEGLLEPNQLCFAPWSDGYYYPAVISDAYPHIVDVAFLDGYTGHATPEHIMGLQEGFEMLDFECRYGWLGFYRGEITSLKPIVFRYYEDGIVQQTELKRLRGVPRFAHRRF
ncbi:MAG: hypothetical protein FWE11_10145 [Defluviitaleaceae bacterium]|nr:hypothetical protein [Defluviitaleaceae bacterium]